MEILTIILVLGLLGFAFRMENLTDEERKNQKNAKKGVLLSQQYNSARIASDDLAPIQRELATEQSTPKDDAQPSDQEQPTQQLLQAPQTTEPTAKMFARWIFILQTTIICLVILIALVETDWEAIKRYLEIVGTDQPANYRRPTNTYSDPQVSGTAALRSLKNIASALIVPIQYLFFGAYGFGWGNKK